MKLYMIKGMCFRDFKEELTGMSDLELENLGYDLKGLLAMTKNVNLLRKIGKKLDFVGIELLKREKNKSITYFQFNINDWKLTTGDRVIYHSQDELSGSAEGIFVGISYDKKSFALMLDWTRQCADKKIIFLPIEYIDYIDKKNYTETDKLRSRQFL